MIRIPPILVVSFFGVLAAVSVLNVQFSANLYEMLPADLPEVQGMDRLSRYFNRDGQLVVTIKAEDAFLAEEAAHFLSERLEAEVNLFSEVHQELSLTEIVTEGGGLLAWLWLNGPPESVEGLTERLGPDHSAQRVADAMASIQSGFFDQGVVIKSYDPLGLSKVGESLGQGGEEDKSGPDPMVSEDGTFHVLYVEGAGVDFSNYREASRWLEEVRPLMHNWEQEWLETQAPDTKLELGLTGTPAFMAEVGSEMEKDMTISVTATMILISILFWIMHRRSRPLSWLVSSMFAILAVTLALGGYIFGDLSVMSAGFAAILMGLAVDYGIVIYREAIDSGHDAKQLRRSVGPGILWAAATTAVVFLSLNFSSLRGLSEMGNLVAIGVAVGAVVMLYFFAPVAARFSGEPPKRKGIQLSGGGVSRRVAGWAAGLVPMAALISIFIVDMPALEANFHPFRIRESPSMVAWQQLQKELRGREDSVPVITTGSNAIELVDHVEEARARIIRAEEEGLLTESVLPIDLIPHAVNQQRNLETIKALISHRERLVMEIESAGFSSEGAELTNTVFDSWENYLEQLESQSFALPVGKMAEWSIDRLFSVQDGVFAALGTVKPTDPSDRAWVEAICDLDTAVASLGSLGTALNERIKSDLLRVFFPMMGLLSLMLSLVFRSWKDLCVSIFALVFAAAVMILLTVWTPMKWNSFNVCGLPLLFGMGLDFSIHMIFALRRCGGDLAMARHGIGKALVFCGSSSAIGFGSLATASAYGLASLGIVCAVGILVNMVVAVWLVPRWYRWIHRMSA
ncbi:MAG: MMPL family transporter [Verrucomicrobiota bacterium]